MKINSLNNSLKIENCKLDIASSLENETKSLSEKMLSNQETITKLQGRINKLESALMVAKQEVKEDYLTHVATKRALADE